MKYESSVTKTLCVFIFNVKSRNTEKYNATDENKDLCLDIANKMNWLH